MASEKDKPEAVPKEKKPGPVLNEEKLEVVPEEKKTGPPPKVPKVKRSQSYFEQAVRILSPLISLLTFFTILREMLEPLGIYWLIFGFYLLFIVAISAWFIILARSKKRLLWEHAVIMLFGILNTAIFFLWVPTWYNEIKCGLYGIKVESPKPNAVIEGSFLVSGSYRLTPPPDSLILINGATYEEKYWPSSFPIQINQTLQTWSGDFYLGGVSGTRANINIALVGKPGRTLYEYYLQVGKDTGQWPSIQVLTKDIKICDKVEVVKK